MSQEQSNRKPRFGGRPPVDDPNQAPRKGPRFSIYWIYAIIFTVLIGFQLYGTFSANTAKTNNLDFREMVLSGDVKKYEIIDNKKTVKVYLTPAGLEKYKAQLKEGITGKISETGPHMSFKYSGDFEKQMDEYYKQNNVPNDQQIKYEVISERDWFGGVLQFLLPILLFVGLWILLMRKMGGGAAGGGGPGGIFNIGKSRATLFDKGTKVNITFADVAGLDEAKVEVMEIV